MLLSLLAGTAAFILFFLYDINSITYKNRFAECFFLIGCAVFVGASGIAVADAYRAGVFSLPADLLWLLAALLAFVCLIYCLFFALPFEKTYIEQQEGRGVYDKGVYALCRHPGVLCFFACWLFLGLAALGHPLILCGMYFSALNLLYVLFQDAVSFPKTFYDYGQYKKTTPFLIPNKESIRRSVRTGKRGSRKEENP